MKAFKFIRPRTAKDAAHWLTAQPGTVLKAAGTDLLDRMKEHVDEPDVVVGLVDTQDLDAIRIEDDGAISIGAKVTLRQLAESDACRRFLPTLAEAAGMAASPQIRNVATIAGNIAQHTRCGYYRRASFPCLKRGDDVCPVKLDGAVQDTAGVFDGDCVSAHPSSLAPVLGALGAEVTYRGKDGAASVPFAQVWATPEKGRATDLALPPGAVIESIDFPARSEKQYTGYAEIRQMAAFDWALVTCAVRYVLDPDGKIGGAHVWFGSVAPTPMRASPAEQALLGQACTDEVAKQAGEAAFAHAKPLPGAAYKVVLAKVALKRALAQARERA